MAEIRETKTTCTAVFSRDEAPEKRSNPVDCALHLFEHYYDPRIGWFWYGVLEIPADSTDEVPLGEPMQCNLVDVELWDGRKGAGRYKGIDFQRGPAVKSWRLGIVGVCGFVA